MDHQEIVRQFAACIVCSQQVCRHFAPRLGIDDSLALRSTTPGTDEKRPEPQGPRPPVVRYQKMLASAFAFFLAGAAQADAGQGLQTLLGDGLAAFAAAGHAVDPVGTALVHGSAGAGEGSFTVQTFKFSGLVKNIHASVSLKQAAIPHEPGLP